MICSASTGLPFSRSRYIDAVWVDSFCVNRALAASRKASLGFLPTAVTTAVTSLRNRSEKSTPPAALAISPTLPRIKHLACLNLRGLADRRSRHGGAQSESWRSASTRRDDSVQSHERRDSRRFQRHHTLAQTRSARPMFSRQTDGR